MFIRIKKGFTPPGNWRIPVIVLLGIFTGLGAYSVYLSKAWSYLSEDSKACVNCHIMAPQYATWNHSSHREVANCSDCHVPHDNWLEKYYFKARDGLNHATLFTMRAERQVIFINKESKEVVKENCIRCHTNQFDQSKLLSQTKGNYQAHNTDRKCWECHRDVPHGEVRSLSSVPNTNVPVPESPVPEWLKELIGK